MAWDLRASLLVAGCDTGQGCRGEVSGPLVYLIGLNCPDEPAVGPPPAALPMGSGRPYKLSP